jgi:uncharacterized protein YprB with RNaseH-like and TPR domain
MNIKDFTHGQAIEEAFAVLSVKEKTTKDGNPMLSVELSRSDGKVRAIVFSEAMEHVSFKERKVYKIQGRAQHYQGSISLLINSASELEGEQLEQYLPQVSTLVFDIETVGKSFDKLSKADQDYLLNSLEKDVESKEAKQRTGLHPLYGFVAFIGMINPNSGKGKVLGLTKKKYVPENKKFKYDFFKDEAGLLKAFWQIVEEYEHIVTFNGRRFDVPFLVFRSLVNKVVIPVDLNRSGSHTDLMQAIRPYGTRVYKLEAICKALGITNPKEKGVSGLHVANLYQQKKFQEIIDYVSRDAISTAELYKQWRTFAPVMV